MLIRSVGGFSFHSCTTPHLKAQFAKCSKWSTCAPSHKMYTYLLNPNTTRMYSLSWNLLKGQKAPPHSCSFLLLLPLFGFLIFCFHRIAPTIKSLWPVRVFGWMVSVSRYSHKRHRLSQQNISIYQDHQYSFQLSGFNGLTEPAERKRSCHKRSLQPRSAAVRDSMSSKSDTGSTKPRVSR